MTRVPDFSGIAAKDTINFIYFDKCALTSMDNIEFMPNLRTVEVARNDSAVLNNIKAVNQLPRLKELTITSGEKFRMKVDIEGIGGLNSLEKIMFESCEVKNTASLSSLKNLRFLRFDTRDPKPDIQFASGMENLFHLSIYGAEGTWGSKTKDPYQEIDLSPLGKLTRLNNIHMEGFILQNADALDSLDNFEGALVMNSVLGRRGNYPKKNFVFYYDGR